MKIRCLCIKQGLRFVVDLYVDLPFDRPPDVIKAEGRWWGLATFSRPWVYNELVLGK